MGNGAGKGKNSTLRKVNLLKYCFFFFWCETVSSSNPLWFRIAVTSWSQLPSRRGPGTAKVNKKNRISAVEEGKTFMMHNTKLNHNFSLGGLLIAFRRNLVHKYGSLKLDLISGFVEYLLLWATHFTFVSDFDEHFKILCKIFFVLLLSVFCFYNRNTLKSRWNQAYWISLFMPINPFRVNTIL